MLKFCSEALKLVPKKNGLLCFLICFACIVALFVCINLCNIGDLFSVYANEINVLSKFKAVHFQQITNSLVPFIVSLLLLFGFGLHTYKILDILLEKYLCCVANGGIENTKKAKLESFEKNQVLQSL